MRHVLCLSAESEQKTDRHPIHCLALLALSARNQFWPWFYLRCNGIAQSQGCPDKEEDQKHTAVPVQCSALGRPLICGFSQYSSFSVPKSQFPEEKLLCLSISHNHFHLTNYFSHRISHEMHMAGHGIDRSPNSLLLSRQKRTQFRSELHSCPALQT